MQKYKDWSPTSLDVAGLRTRGEPDYGEWFVVPTTKTRDSEPREESDFDCSIALLEKRGDDERDDDGYEDFVNLSFNHWACGWFEIILVQPDTPAFAIGEDIAKWLCTGMPIDENDLMQRESDAHHDEVHEHCHYIVNGLFHNDLDETLLATYAETHIDNIDDWSLKDGYSPLAIASALEWDYMGRYPDDDAVFDQLLEQGAISVTLKVHPDD